MVTMPWFSSLGSRSFFLLFANFHTYFFCIKLMDSTLVNSLNLQSQFRSALECKSESELTNFHMFWVYDYQFSISCDNNKKPPTLHKGSQLKCSSTFNGPKTESWDQFFEYVYCSASLTQLVTCQLRADKILSYLLTFE